MFMGVDCFLIDFCCNKIVVLRFSTYLLLKVIMKVKYLVIKVLAECAKADYIYVDVVIKIISEIILYLQMSGVM